MQISRWLFLLAALMLAGCATTRGVVDLSVEQEDEAAEPGESRGKVYIGTISDSRVFELKPRQPSTPSLKDGQITNAALKARAIARKRNTFGLAMGDILLPEERTVVDVVRENVTLALHNSGYEVVEAPGDDAVVEGYAHQRHQTASTGAWLQTIDVGMGDLRANLETKLAE